MTQNIKCIESINHSIYFEESGYEMLNQIIENNRYSKVFVLCDTNSNEYCLVRLFENLTTQTNIEIVEIENGEENKNIETCIELWKILTDLGADRKSLILNLGGGVITDIGGFVASTYKRGIDFIHIPTTLLAMVDAAIGGKNGVDLDNLKNQVGIIANPKMILIDYIFLETLPQNQLQSGYAEMLKHGLIADKNYWEKFALLENRNNIEIEQLIFDSILIKNNIVLQDPTENGIRKALNFGHTIGHAIESYHLENDTKQTLLHGEAIAIGMILESYISWKLNLIEATDYIEIKTTINAIFDIVSFDKKDIEAIEELLIHDKKNEYGKIQFALLDGIGNIKLNQTVSNELIYKAFEDYGC